MKAIFILFVTTILVGCKQNVKEISQDFFHNDHKKFVGFGISQFGRGCLVNVHSEKGYDINISKLDIPNRPLFSEDSIAFELIEFCKRNNLYSYNNSKGEIIGMSNNSYWSYKELKEMDVDFYYKVLEDLNIDDSSKNYLDLPLSVCFMQNPGKQLKDSISNLTKIYKINDTEFYFWQLTPTYFDCENCLIH